jgi:hypothetical protein
MVGSGRGTGEGFGSGDLESVEALRRRSGRCPGGHAKMLQDLGNHGGIYDGEPDTRGSEVARPPPLAFAASEAPRQVPLSALMPALRKPLGDRIGVTAK